MAWMAGSVASSSVVVSTARARVMDVESEVAAAFRPFVVLFGQDCARRGG